MARGKALKVTFCDRSWLEFEWPLTIIASRYSGTYEGGKYLAFPLCATRLDEEIYGDDTDCDWWFTEYRLEPIGRGATPDKALKDLRARVGGLARRKR